MSDLVGPGTQDAREIQEMMGRFDAPAYVRRARQVEDAYQRLLDQCRRQREEWLHVVRVRLGQLFALAGDRDGLRKWLAEEDTRTSLFRLHDELRPVLRVVPQRSGSDRILRRAAATLEESITRFNRRWLPFLANLDLQTVNRLREGYNRHYLLEKECALRSPRLAREGFQRLRPLTIDDLAAVYPPLPELRFAGVRP